MPRLSANGQELEVERRGDPSGPPLVLVNGIGTQLVTWPDPFVEGLVAAGLHLVLFDNRDAGLSSKIEGIRVPAPREVAAMMRQGLKPPVPYTLHDMAADTAALITALGLRRAHVLGLSMGGMIAQLLAADHPQTVASLTSIMSTTGERSVGQPSPRGLAALTTPPPALDRESLIAHSIWAQRQIASPAWPRPEAEVRAIAARAYDRAYEPAGFLRQYAAILATGSFRDRLARVRAPTLILHGTDDPLVDISGGRDSAAAIPGARLIEIPGMGHDLPASLCPRLVELVVAHVRAV